MVLPRVALCLGDPAGIGPELCLQAAHDAALGQCCEPVIIGDEALFHRVVNYSAQLDPRLLDSVKFHCPDDWQLDASAVRPGEIDADHGQAAVSAVGFATQACLSGEYDALVTAPWHKTAVQASGLDVPGHTEYLAQLCDCEHVVMLLHSERIRVALLTIHQSLASVPGSLSIDQTKRIARLVSQAVSRELGRPARLTMLALNPHAGENGHFGREEIELFQPAVNQLRQEGIVITDPLSADTAFTRWSRAERCLLSLLSRPRLNSL